MKTLDLLRHAKAEVPDYGQSDHSRALAKKGLKQCQEKAARAKDLLKPSLVWCSDALRTKQTAQNIGAELGIANIVYDPALYLSGLYDYIEVLKGTPEEFSHAMVVGHNPTMADLAYHLCPDFNQEVKTSSWLRLELPIESWAQLRRGKANQVFFWI